MVCAILIRKTDFGSASWMTGESSFKITEDSGISVICFVNKHKMFTFKFEQTMFN